MIASTARQSWVVIAAFFTQGRNIWLDDFITDPALSFRKIPPPRHSESWHHRRSRLTSLSEWGLHLRHAWRAMRQKPDGIVTCFPQLAMCVALLKRFSHHKPYLIAYNYNLGELLPGRRRKLARFVAQEIDCFVVHSPHEIAPYAAYLAVPPERLIFAPLQRGVIETARDEDQTHPFLVAMGSARRDYRLLIAAVDRLHIPTIIITRTDDIATLPKSPDVTFMSGLTEDECQHVLARARICVTPIDNQETASGQVTFIQAMQMGIPAIATHSPGTDGYITDNETGLLVEPGDLEGMVLAIHRLWDDPDLRDRLAHAAQEEALHRFSDEAAAQGLHDTIMALPPHIS